MKKIFILVVITIILINCSMPSIDNNWYNLNEIPNQIINEKSGGAIVSWVINNIDYELYANGFNLAQETLDTGKGNCANMSLLEIALWYKLTGEKGNLIYCSNSKGLHYCAQLSDKIWESDIKEIYDIIKFDDIAEFIYYRQ